MIGRKIFPLFQLYQSKNLKNGNLVRPHDWREWVYIQLTQSTIACVHLLRVQLLITGFCYLLSLPIIALDSEDAKQFFN